MSSKVSAVGNGSAPVPGATRLHSSLSSSTDLISFMHLPPETRKADACRPLHYAAAPWHFLYFFPLPHGQGSFRPTLFPSRFTCCGAPPSPLPLCCDIMNSARRRF